MRWQMSIDRRRVVNLLSAGAMTKGRDAWRRITSEATRKKDAVRPTRRAPRAKSRGATDHRLTPIEIRVDRGSAVASVPAAWIAA
jgi:hypothetical protein